MDIRIVQERLSDGSKAYNVHLSDEWTDTALRLHAVTLSDAQTFAEQLAVLVKAHTVETPRIGWGHGL